MIRREDQEGCRARVARICGGVLATVLSLSLGVEIALAETQLVIDPTEVPEAPKPDAPTTAKPAQPDARLKRERRLAEEEQRKRAKAEARALAAENEAAKLRAMEQARQAEAAAKDAAAKSAARKAAAAKAAAARAEAANMTRARIAAEKAAAEKEAARREAAARQLAARELAERETAARELAAREAAAREAAAREAAARKAAAREAAAREAAAREVAAREAAAKEAQAREVAARETAAREAAAREAAAKEAAAKEAAAREAIARQAAAQEAAAKLAAAKQVAFREARASRAHSRFGTVFRDCASCPELVWLPRGEFTMGEPSATSGPRHVVRISYMLAVGRFEVTFAEWDACVAAGGCSSRPDDSGWGRGRQPVINVSWADAQQYAAWLMRRTGKHYRLLTEAEWEYAARAGSDVRYWWGNQAGHGQANCYDCGSRWDGRQAAPVGRFFPNPFGLYDMHGNVSEWVEDCYHDRYRDAPSDGTAWTLDCPAISDARMVRGGAWRGPTGMARSAARSSAPFDYYDNQIGFRIARTE